MKSDWPIFLLLFVSWEIFAKSKVTKVFSYFVLEAYKVLAVTFRSVIHFELIFICIIWGMGQSSFLFFVCLWISSHSSPICLKRLSFSTELPVVPLSKISSLILICVFIYVMPTHCLDYSSFVINVEVSGISLFFFFKVVWLFWVLHVSIWILESFLRM